MSTKETDKNVSTDVLKKDRGHAKANVTRVVNQVESLVEGSDVPQVTKLMTAFNQALDVFETKHTEYHIHKCHKSSRTGRVIRVLQEIYGWSKIEVHILHRHRR